MVAILRGSSSSWCRVFCSFIFKEDFFHKVSATSQGTHCIEIFWVMGLRVAKASILFCLQWARAWKGKKWGWIRYKWIAMILRALKRGRIDYFRKKLVWVKVRMCSIYDDSLGIPWYCIFIAALKSNGIFIYKFHLKIKFLVLDGLNVLPFIELESLF